MKWQCLLLYRGFIANVPVKEFWKSANTSKKWRNIKCLVCSRRPVLIGVYLWTSPLNTVSAISATHFFHSQPSDRQTTKMRRNTRWFVVVDAGPYVIGLVNLAKLLCMHCKGCILWQTSEGKRQTQFVCTENDGLSSSVYEGRSKSKKFSARPIVLLRIKLK